MKAILEFELPQESEEHQLALNGWKYKSIIDDIFAKIRHMDKYEDKDSIELDELRSFISEKLNEF